MFIYFIAAKNQTLGKLNHNLREANFELKEQGQRILEQNQHILQQQDEIIEQKNRLVVANKELEDSNTQVEQQQDALKEMIGKVESLSKAKLDFFTNISHELRTPLSLIAGPLEQLLEGHDEMSDHQREELLKLANRNSSRLLILINQLLELRKIEHSSLGSTPVPGNLVKTVEATMELFQNLAMRRNLDLSLDNSLSAAWFILIRTKWKNPCQPALQRLQIHPQSGAYQRFA
ncbi:MAG: histidine kinase dimerization/phospho-acceptor domain-containing protein [Bacteroidia bacterium]